MGGAQAGEEQVLGGDGPAQHAGDALGLGALGNAGDPMDALPGRSLRRRVLTTGSKVRPLQTLLAPHVTMLRSAKYEDTRYVCVAMFVHLIPTIFDNRTETKSTTRAKLAKLWVA